MKFRDRVCLLLGILALPINSMKLGDSSNLRFLLRKLQSHSSMSSQTKTKEVLKTEEVEGIDDNSKNNEPTQKQKK